jgi:hypothetical protein
MSLSPECVSLLNWTLCDEWDAVVILSAALPNAVPMDCVFHAFHVILNIDDDTIVFTYLNTWPWNHTICRQNSSLDAISQHALTVTPYGICGVWCAHLACTAK